MNLKLLLTAIIALACSFAAASQEHTPGESKMVYVKSFDHAIAVSKKEKKPIFANFHASWAGPCLSMDAFVFSDEDFAKFMDKNFVNLKIDVKSDEGRQLADKYGISSYPAYLILNSNGEVLQPISRGADINDFKDKVSLGLNPKTTLVETTKKYESGKYSKKDLYNYLYSLIVAGKVENYNQLVLEYLQYLSPKDYSDPRNWKVLQYIRDTDSDFYKYVSTHRQEMSRKIDDKLIQAFVERPFSRKVLKFATSDNVNPDEIKTVGENLQQLGIPDSSLMLVVYNIGKLRNERKFTELLDYMDRVLPLLARERQLTETIEMSFSFPDMDDSSRQAVIAYLQRRASEQNNYYAPRYTSLAESLSPKKAGIIFRHEKYADLINAARQEGKLIFMDCYTSWCGPCRNLAANVFTDAALGEFFNNNFICCKFDMEAGEGPELAKKFGIQAFPTMLFIDGEGNVVERVVGFRDVNALMDIAGKLAK